MAGVLRCFLVRIDEVSGRNEASSRSLAFPICRCLRAAEGFLLAVAWGFDGELVATGEEPAGRACGTPPLVPMASVRPKVPVGLMGSLSHRPAGAPRPKEKGIPQPARILLPAGNPRAFLISFSSRCGTTGSPPRSLHTARRRTAPIKTGKLSSGVGISLVIIHRFRIFRHIPRLH